MGPCQNCGLVMRVGLSDNLVVAINHLCRRLAEASAKLGREVLLDPIDTLDRSCDLTLQPPGLISANRTCRLLQTADSWVALNLARNDDIDMIPALIEENLTSPHWTAIESAAKRTTGADFVSRARLLGMPAGLLSERRASTPLPLVLNPRPISSAVRSTIRVLDISSLWAGPLCGSILAAIGADVIKLESQDRPDPTPAFQPELNRRLNRAKTLCQLNFSSPRGREQLRHEICQADIVISNARPRAFEPLGIEPATMFEQNRKLIWVAITGHGWTGNESEWTGFGDDAAISGGLVNWSPELDRPSFLGDALADPLTGISAAIGAIDAVLSRTSCLMDAALSRTAAGIRHWSDHQLSNIRAVKTQS